MISINNLTVTFGGFTLFEELSFHVNKSDRIGLTGRNGSGKSTLMKILAGVTQPASGIIQIPSSKKAGYLPQEMECLKDITVLQETLKAFAHITEIKDEITNINSQIAQRDDYKSESYHKLLVLLNDLTERLNVLDSGNFEANAERVLFGLGFKREEFDRKRSELSQGWNMRIELAKVLLSNPDILLLDEPTNHLDIESIRWLESYLKEYKGPLILISHDRKFLDTLTNRTVEIVLGKINDYKVPYSKYLVLRKERMEQQRAAFENQQKMIEKTEQFIERFRYKATKSNQVQSRIKQLEKVERVEIEEADNSRLYVKFPSSPRSGQVVIKAEGAGFSYGLKKIFSNANIVIERGEKVALLGKNGEGKTTFMRLITGELSPTVGKILPGHNVKLGYYAQNQEDLLQKNDTVFETLDKIAVGDIRTKLRDILGAFLFRGEDIDKKVAVLSGGERSRLAMAKLILEPYNLLALDEPTNHMDIRSKDILKQALLKYDGTLVLVSHDRDFLEGLVDKIYEFRDGVVKEHLGGLNDFLERKKIETLEELQFVGNSAIKEKIDGENPETEGAANRERAESYRLRREIEKEAQRKRKRIEKCEEKIAEQESIISKIEKELNKSVEHSCLSELLEDYAKRKSRLDSLLNEWEELHNE